MTVARVTTMVALNGNKVVLTIRCGFQEGALHFDKEYEGALRDWVFRVESEAMAERRVPLDRWSTEWALEHAKKASNRLLEIEISTYEALGDVNGDSERAHLEILRAELQGRD